MEYGITSPNLLPDGGEDAGVHPANLALYLLHQRLDPRQRRLCQAADKQTQAVNPNVPPTTNAKSRNSEARNERIAAAAAASRASSLAEERESNSSGARTGGEHLVDVLEGAGLVHVGQRSRCPERPLPEDLERSSRRIWKKGGDPVGTRAIGERGGAGAGLPLARAGEEMEGGDSSASASALSARSADLCSAVVGAES